MLGTDNAAERSKWSVLWVKDKRIVVKECGNDLAEAIRLYTLVKGKRPGATLRCNNFGFPPPDKYLPYPKKMKRRLDPPNIVKRGRKRYRQTHEVVTVMVDPMREKNKQGIYWCPYCREFRRFKIRQNFVVGSIKVQDRAFVCPMCKVTHRDFNVRKYNPVAIQVYYEMEQTNHRAPARDRKADYRKKKRRKRNGS